MRSLAPIALATALVAPVAALSCGSDVSNDAFSSASTSPSPSGSGAASGGTGSAAGNVGGSGASGMVGGSGGLQGGAGPGGSGPGGASPGGAGGVNVGGGIGTGAVAGGGPVTESECQNHVYECGDLLDNDSDGLIDSMDPDCLGPCDNTENSYFGGIPGQAGPPCTVDCYFDQDSGAGNDDCHWNHECDPHEVAPNYYPESSLGNACEYDPGANTPGTGASCDELYTTQSQECMDYCGPLTPNGCDCFGCCELPAGSGSYVWLGSEDGNGNGTCTIADVSDPSKCQPCLPVAACLNDCDYCEVCIGKPVIPPECFPGMGGAGGGGGAGGAGGANVGGAGGSGGDIGMQCPPGVQVCGQPGQAPCPTSYYCITGCCQPISP